MDWLNRQTIVVAEYSIEVKLATQKKTEVKRLMTRFILKGVLEKPKEVRPVLLQRYALMSLHHFSPMQTIAKWLAILEAFFYLKWGLGKSLYLTKGRHRRAHCDSFSMHGSHAIRNDLSKGSSGMKSPSQNTDTCTETVKLSPTWYAEQGSALPASKIRW